MTTTMMMMMMLEASEQHVRVIERDCDVICVRCGVLLFGIN